MDITERRGTNKSSYHTSVNRLDLRIIFDNREIGAVGLEEAIVEAIDKAGIIDEAGIRVIEAECPDLKGGAITIWFDPPPLVFKTEEDVVPIPEVNA